MLLPHDKADDDAVWLVIETVFAAGILGLIVALPALVVDVYGGVFGFTLFALEAAFMLWIIHEPTPGRKPLL